MQNNIYFYLNVWLKIQFKVIIFIQVWTVTQKSVFLFSYPKLNFNQFHCIQYI